MILIYILCLGAFAYWLFRFVKRLNRQHPGKGVEPAPSDNKEKGNRDVK